MKIFAFYVTAIRSTRKIDGICFEVAEDGLEAEKEVRKNFESIYAIRNNTIKIVASGSMDFEKLAKKLKPEVEKLIKENKIKSDLLDIIKKLPIS